jgi:hypothetical protein
MRFVAVTFTPAQLAALGTYLEAEREAAYWKWRCDHWTRLCGFSVWREGHPLDREKLRQRRIWRRRAAVERQALRRALGVSS